MENDLNINLNINNNSNLEDSFEIGENINEFNSIEEKCNYYKKEYLKYKSKYDYINNENNKLIKERNKLLFKIGLLKNEIKEGNMLKLNNNEQNIKNMNSINNEEHNDINIIKNDESFDIDKEIEKLNENIYHKDNEINDGIFQTLKEEVDEQNKNLDELSIKNNNELEEKVLLTLESMNFGDEEEEEDDDNIIKNNKNQSEKNLILKNRLSKDNNQIKEIQSRKTYNKDAKIKKILAQKNLIINSILSTPHNPKIDLHSTMPTNSYKNINIKFDESIIEKSLTNEFIYYTKDSMHLRRLIITKEKKINSLYNLLKKWGHYSKNLKKGIEAFYKAIELFNNNLLKGEKDIFTESPDLLGLIYLLQKNLNDIMEHCKSLINTFDSLFLLQLENTKKNIQSIKIQRYNLALKINELINIQSKFLSTKKSSYSQNSFISTKENYYKKYKTIEIYKYEYISYLNKILMITQIEIPQIISLFSFSLMVFFRQVHTVLTEIDGPIKDNLEKINARINVKNKVIENMKKEKKELETKLFDNMTIDKNLMQKEGFVNIRENENNSNFRRIYIKMHEGNLIYFKTRKSNINMKEDGFDSKVYLNMIERIEIKEYYDLCNLLLSNVKKNEKKYEYPFCFEITDASSKKTFILQGDTEYETEEWICTIQNAISDRISTFQEITDLNDKKNGNKIQNNLNNNNKEEINDINNKKITNIINNNICADCGAKNPTWLCINWLVIICIDCSAIHRSLGANISKVKGFRLDNISNDYIELLDIIKQEEINAILEKNLKDGEKPIPESEYNIKEQFIIEKYKNKKYLENCNLDMNKEEKIKLLINAIEENNLLDIYKYIKQNFDNINELYNINGEEYGLLHYCAYKGYIQIIKLLYALGADINKEDSKGLKPIIYAKLKKNTEIIEYLNKKEKS